MLGNLVKRLLNAAVLGLAGLTFFLVPIGRKTAFQHTVAIFTSPPAREAGASFAETGRRTAESVHAEVKRLLASSSPDAKPTSSPAAPPPRGEPSSRPSPSRPDNRP